MITIHDGVHDSNSVNVTLQVQGENDNAPVVTAVGANEVTTLVSWFTLEISLGIAILDVHRGNDRELGCRLLVCQCD